MVTESSQAEIKQQGIIETAQAAATDPQSKIQPELVEKKLVEESRKAGAAAYQFNPNDSPEEKAKAVNAVSQLLCEFCLSNKMANLDCYMQSLHPDFHNPNKQKGLAVVSDKVRTEQMLFSFDDQESS